VAEPEIESRPLFHVGDFQTHPAVPVIGILIIRLDAENYAEAAESDRYGNRDVQRWLG